MVLYPAQILLGFQPLISNSQLLHIHRKFSRRILALNEARRHKIFRHLFHSITAVCHLLGNDKRKRRSLPVLTVYMNFSPHQRHQLPADGKAKSGSLHIPISLAVKLLKRLKESVHVALPDSTSRIRHRHIELYLVLRYLQKVYF